MAISDEFKHTVGKALGRVPSGLFILTATHDGKSDAMLASWVQQASFDPPTISIAIGKGRGIVDLIKAGKTLVLSIVPEGDTSLMKRYARGVKPGEDPFAGVEIVTTPGGWVAMKSAIAWLECQLLQTCDFGADHELLIAKVVRGELLQQGQSFTHQRGSGFHY
jgi:3-hydroxy-9,10-secoandrosta-1,3,5(10)-triene-9,17-dione monooxygenase reductase component